MKSFTLVELVIVIAVIGILTAVLAPAFSSVYDNIKMEGAYRQLMQDIRYVQYLAVARQVPHGISFNPYANSYFAYRQTTSNTIKDPATQKQYIVSYSTGKFSGIDLVSTTFVLPLADTLEFTSSGAPAGSGSITIVYKGITKIISVEANTGRVQ